MEFSTVRIIIHICWTGTQLGARLVMVLFTSANGHRSGGHRKEREARMLVGRASSRRDGAELSRLRDVRTCGIDKGWKYLCRWIARGPGRGWLSRKNWVRGTHLEGDAEPNG